MEAIGAGMIRKLTRQKIRSLARRWAKQEMAKRKLTVADGVTRHERRKQEAKYAGMAMREWMRAAHVATETIVDQENK